MLPNLCLVKSKPKNSRILQIESKFLKAIEKISPNAVKSAQERIDLINLSGSSKNMTAIYLIVYEIPIWNFQINHKKERFLSKIETVAAEMIEEEKLISDAWVEAEILHSDDENDITHFESFKNWNEITDSSIKQNCLLQIVNKFHWCFIVCCSFCDVWAFKSGF